MEDEDEKYVDTLFHFMAPYLKRINRAVGSGRINYYF